MSKELTVLVPTRNENDNIAPLVNRIVAGLPPGGEIIFVDDSDDGTPERIRAVAQTAGAAGWSVLLAHRRPDERIGGLGGAVADLVIASRRVTEGSVHGFGALRRVVSHSSGWLAKALFPHRLRGVSDPMSGFFLVRRQAVDADTLRPRGFKILLELVVAVPGLRVAEVGFAFGTRHAGESKASWREGVIYLGHLAELRRRTWLRPAHQGWSADARLPEGVEVLT